MPGACCKGKGKKKHTPIVSKSQAGLFGAELARRRAGEKPQMKGITEEELSSHLHEAKGKNLPKKKGRRNLRYG